MGGEPDIIRQQLKHLREGLYRLHKALVDSERVEYERIIGPIKSPAEFVHLLMTDSWFAWLRPHSQLLVAMDETLEKETPLTVAQFKELADRCRALMFVSDNDQDHLGHYFQAMQRDPDVILTHAEVTKRLSPHPLAGE